MKEYFVLNLLRQIVFLPVWWLERLKKREPMTWVFGSWYGENYSDNCRILYEYVTENCPQINATWITRSQDVYNRLNSQNRKVAFADSKEGVRICRKAKFAIISNTAHDINQMHVNGITKIWIWHGHPLKKIVYDQPVTKRSFKETVHRLFPYSKPNADIVLNTSSFFSPYYQTAFRVPADKVVITGYPRNDSLFKSETTPFISGLRQKYPQSRIIMYMPTFRDVMYKDKKAFDPFDGFAFDMTTFNEFLERNNLVFLFKGHYVDIKNQKTFHNDGGRFVFVDGTMYDDLYSFIKDTDILVTDYSSIYFDYLLLRKPIILAPFDKDDYCRASRPMYFSYDDNIEGIQAHDWNEFIDIVENNKFYTPSQGVLDKYHYYQDGNSSKRVTEYILSLI